jgi:hypothetical protein
MKMFRYAMIGCLLLGSSGSAFAACSTVHIAKVKYTATQKIAQDIPYMPWDEQQPDRGNSKKKNARVAQDIPYMPWDEQQPDRRNSKKKNAQVVAANDVASDTCK